MKSLKGLTLPKKLRRIKSFTKSKLLKEYYSSGQEKEKQILIAVSSIKLRLRKRRHILKCKIYFDGFGMYWVFGYIDSYRVYGARSSNITDNKTYTKECIAALNNLAYAWDKNEVVYYMDSWGTERLFDPQSYKSLSKALKGEVALGDVGFY